MENTCNNLLFINEYQNASFSKMRRELSVIKRNDHKVLSAIFIASISITLEEILLPFIKGETYELNIDTDTENGYDERTITMARLAAAMLNDRYSFDVNELSKLDPLYLQLALNVMSYRYMPQNDNYEYIDNYSITK